MSTAAWIRLLALLAVGLALRALVAPEPPAPEPRLPEPVHARHRNTDGSPRYTNRLARESSPYLRQHAHNPVDWYPWGEEAFTRARAERKPILLSIGYSTCHWCHVMAAESFEDEAVARMLNERYVAVKVDREERPDVDAVYMAAVQAMGRGGGWPLTVWLTPDLRPFWGGTYFPPRAGDRGRSAGFVDYLERLDDAWRSDPDRVGAAAADVTQRLEAAFAVVPGTEVPGPVVLGQAAAALSAQFDHEHGGFGREPKFPRPVTLDLLLRWYRRTSDGDALGMVVQTLDAMAAGGIHDQLGGGFHRYATDRKWRVPHFEKMLYDNALLATAYFDAARAASRPDFAAVARRILDWMLREMQAPEGGFFAAVDAVSDGHEGRYYVWTPEEVAAALDPDTAPLVAAWFGVTPGGNFDGGRTVLHLPSLLPEVAAGFRLDPAEANRRIARATERLREARAARPAPAVDRKVVTAWNGLAIGALARGTQVLGDPRYADAAARAADVLLRRRRDGTRLHRSAIGGVASGRGVLEDHAFVVAGLLDLHEVRREPRWLADAIALQEAQDRHFGDSVGGWFRTADDAERLLVREKPDYDGAEPSGASVAVLNVQRLHALTGDDRWRRTAEAALRAHGPSLQTNPTGSPLMAAALECWLDRPKEIVVVVPPGVDPGPLLSEVNGRYLPNRALTVMEAGEPQRALATLVPLVADKTARDGKATAYVCERQVCRLPTTEPAALGAELDRVAPLP